MSNVSWKTAASAFYASGKKHSDHASDTSWRQAERDMSLLYRDYEQRRALGPLLAPCDPVFERPSLEDERQCVRRVGGASINENAHSKRAMARLLADDRVYWALRERLALLQQEHEEILPTHKEALDKERARWLMVHQGVLHQFAARHHQLVLEHTQAQQAVRKHKASHVVCTAKLRQVQTSLQEVASHQIDACEHARQVGAATERALVSRIRTLEVGLDDQTRTALETQRQLAATLAQVRSRADQDTLATKKRYKEYETELARSRESERKLSTQLLEAHLSCAEKTQRLDVALSKQEELTRTLEVARAHAATLPAVSDRVGLLQAKVQLLEAEAQQHMRQRDELTQAMEVANQSAQSHVARMQVFAAREAELLAKVAETEKLRTQVRELETRSAVGELVAKQLHATRKKLAAASDANVPTETLRTTTNSTSSPSDDGSLLILADLARVIRERDEALQSVRTDKTNLRLVQQQLIRQTQESQVLLDAQHNAHMIAAAENERLVSRVTELESQLAATESLRQDLANITEERDWAISELYATNGHMEEQAALAEQMQSLLARSRSGAVDDETSTVA